MGFREDYDRLIEILATDEKADDILKAKEEFWRLTGKMHGDEPSFEMRMSAFFEWYVFERKVDGKTPLENLLGDSGQRPTEEVETYRGFLDSIHSVFIVKRIAPDGMRVRDLFTKKIHFLNGEDASLGFYRDAVFEGRIIPYKGGLYLSPALCFHPKDSKVIIKHVLKKARKAGDTDVLPLIHRLSYMNLKWETYRNVKVKHIYRFEEYEKKRWWNW